MSKTDAALGQRIEQELIKHRVETPRKENHKLDKDQVRNSIQSSFTLIMELLGLDLDNDSLKETPRRVAKMYVDEIFSGLDYANFPKCTTVENQMGYDEMVTVDGISSLSVCEHHFVTIDGLAKISYIPKNKVLGLSKINRIVKFFSRRPQIQERLTEQIYFALAYILETEDVAVRIKATHYCVKSRGVEDTGSETTTTKLGGVFKSREATRLEFLTK